MRLHFLLLTTGALVVGFTAAASENCNYRQEFVAGQTLSIFSPNYPSNYPKGVDCRWKAVAPSNSKLLLNCTTFSLPASSGCSYDRLSVSLTGDESLSDAHAYCGSGPFSLQSTNNILLITLTAPYFSNGGSFYCSLTATVPVTPKPPTCDCGWKKESRIVNGRETGINEYPSMAALVDFQIREIVCGSTVIAIRYVLTAAHCLLNRQPTATGVLVGDHDISTGSETNAAVLLTAVSFRAHPDYNSVTQQNDIAVVRVNADIKFSLEVGPACLPFRFPNTAVGTVVQVLGWGTTEYTGMKSDKLLGTQLNIVNISSCQQTFINKVSTETQLCTYKQGTDACQADSGGPLLWQGPGNRLQLLGIISYGKSCATEKPGVNTRVYPFIDWILDVTLDVQYCVR